MIAGVGDDSKLALARSLGAAVAVNYSAPGWTERVRAATDGRGVDVVLASAAGAVFTGSLNLLGPLGHLVVWGAPNSAGTELDQAGITRIVYANQRISGYAFPTYPVELTRAATRDALDLLDDRSLEVTIGGRYRLDEVAQAHRDVESRKTVGKLVVIP